MAKAKRYAQVIELVHEAKPADIIEIGVWNGGRAMEMAAAALKHSGRVHYTGFDLFEEATAETNEVEFNAKKNNTLGAVEGRLKEFADKNAGFTFELVRGNTRDTLEGDSLTADFVYIDGGHSVKTIRGDYEAVKHSGMVVFDDYYRLDADGRCPDLDAVGANRIVDAIKGAEVLDSSDPVMGGGVVCIAVVRND